MKKVYAIIVTYADRYHYLEQVIKSCLLTGVSQVVVVDNGSVYESHEKLKQFVKNNRNYVKALYLPKNHGSSGGYKRGLKYCFDSKECEYVWLLDDDNRPENNALNKLLEFWDMNKAKQNNNFLALLSYRSDREGYKDAIVQKKPGLMLGRKNSFLGFHIMDLPRKASGKLQFRKKLERSNVTSGVVLVAPYGGLFFNKSLLKSIGYPDESFFVYGDDYDFTFRITKLGGKIFLVTDSVISDLEKSFHLEGGLFSSKIINATNTNQCYYMTRNNIRFESLFISSLPAYYINAITYTIANAFLVVLSMRVKSFKNYKSFLKGMYDGFSL